MKIGAIYFFVFNTFAWYVLCFLSFSCIIALARYSSQVLNKSHNSEHLCLHHNLTGKAFLFFFFFLAVVFSVYAPNQFEEVLNHSYSLRRFIVKGWMFNFVKCVFINIMMLSSAFSFSLILSWCVKLHWRVFKNQARHIFSESTPLGIDYYYFYTLLDPVY